MTETGLQSNGELGRIAEENALAPAPEGFTPRPPEDEELFLRTGPIAEVAKYLQAKYPTG